MTQELACDILLRVARSLSWMRGSAHVRALRGNREISGLASGRIPLVRTGKARDFGLALLVRGESLGGRPIFCPRATARALPSPVRVRIRSRWSEGEFVHQQRGGARARH
jgi:hypothetical protein